MVGLVERLREERGLTLAELLSAQLVAGVVMAAAAILVITSLRGEQRVSDKVNSVSQGRTVAAQLEQRLNSQVCLFTGEYAIGGATGNVAAKSILHASPDSLVYFADISERSAGATNGVGFQPSIRYLLAPTAGTGRRGGFVDAYRSATNNAIPFNFSLGGSYTLASLGALNGPTLIPPNSVLHRVGDGVTNAVTGSTSTPVPFLQYWTSDQLGPTGTPVTMVSGVVPSSQIDQIGRIRVNYRVLAASGRDSTSGPTGTLDNRTETFATDIYLRTTPDICDQLGT